eukprot:5525225-Amphidinium_carterae.2
MTLIPVLHRLKGYGKTFKITGHFRYKGYVCSGHASTYVRRVFVRVCSSIELMVFPELVSPHLKCLITFAGPQHQSLGDGFRDYVSGQGLSLTGRISPDTGQSFTST